jgi:hypothetical protein
MLVMKQNMFDQSFLKIHVKKAKLHERVSPTKALRNKLEGSISPGSRKNLNKIRSFDIQLDQVKESPPRSLNHRLGSSSSDEDSSGRSEIYKGKAHQNRLMSDIVNPSKKGYFEEDGVLEKPMVNKPEVIILKQYPPSDVDDQPLEEKEKEEVIDHVVDFLQSSALLRKSSTRDNIKTMLLSEASPLHAVTRRQSRQIAEWKGGYIYSEDFENRILEFLEHEGVEIVEKAGKTKSLMPKVELTLGERKLSSILSKRNLLNQHSLSPEKKPGAETEIYE